MCSIQLVTAGVSYTGTMMPQQPYPPGQQYQYIPQQTYQLPPPQKPKEPFWKTAWFWGIIGGVVVLSLIMIAGSTGTVSPTSTPTPSSTKTTARPSTPAVSTTMPVMSSSTVPAASSASPSWTPAEVEAAYLSGAGSMAEQCAGVPGGWQCYYKHLGGSGNQLVIALDGVPFQALDKNYKPIADQAARAFYNYVHCQFPEITSILVWVNNVAFPESPSTFGATTKC